MKTYQFTIDQARQVGDKLGIDWSRIDISQFLRGMNVELEHGLVNDQTNITNDNDLLTGKIAWAHLNEQPDYYSRLEQVESSPRLTVDLSHYYGNRVRQIFMIAAAVMLVGLPFVQDILSVPNMISIVAILILDFLAALANPKQSWIHWVNTLTSAIAVIVFEFFAVTGFALGKPLFFVANQALALLFLVSFYFNTKTVRNIIVK